MTSKERIIRIFKGEPVDRVGCFEQTIACSVASDILGRQAFTGGTGLQYHEECAWWEGDEAHDDFVRQVMEDTIEISNVLGFDMVRPRGPSLSAPPTDRIDEYTFRFGGRDGRDEVIMRFDPDAETWGVLKAPEERPDIRSQVEAMERSLEELSDDTIDSELWALDWFVERVGRDKAVLDGTGFISIPLHEDWLVACVEEPQLVGRYLDCVAERAIRKLPFVRKHGADVIWAGGDLAGNQGPIYGPRVFRELLLPRLRRIVEKCHELGLPYVFRSDGNLWSIADDLFVESGVDGYGEIDVNAGMDIGELRRRFPKLVLCGNVSCSTVLHLGSVDDVIREARICIDKARGGGHIVGSSNSIVHGTPAENVIAMFETAREYGRME